MNYAVLSKIEERKTSMELLSLLASIVTFLALCIALWQSLEAKKQGNALKTIHESLTTRFLGAFVISFLNKLVGTLESVEESLVILVDTPAYADFSYHSEGLRIIQAIERAIENPRIRVTYITRAENGRRQVNRQQFKKEEHEQWRNLPDSREKLVSLLGTNVDTSKLEYQEFEDALERHRLEILARFRRAASRSPNDNRDNRVRILEDVQPSPINLWIVDGKRAIFALIGYSSGASEYGFETSDFRLIAALNNIVEDKIKTIDAGTSTVSDISEQ